MRLREHRLLPESRVYDELDPGLRRGDDSQGRGAVFAAVARPIGVLIPIPSSRARGFAPRPGTHCECGCNPEIGPGSQTSLPKCSALRARLTSGMTVCWQLAR